MKVSDTILCLFMICSVRSIFILAEGSCGRGFYCATTSCSSCLPCPIGWYQNRLSFSGTNCIQCQATCTTNGIGSTGFDDCYYTGCSAGEYAPKCTRACFPCPTGYKSSRGSKSCELVISMSPSPSLSPHLSSSLSPSNGSSISNSNENAPSINNHDALSYPWKLCLIIGIISLGMLAFALWLYFSGLEPDPDPEPNNIWYQNLPPPPSLQLIRHTHTFLSHDWGHASLKYPNHSRISRINRALKSRGLSTWFDEERIINRIDEKIIEGLENTKTMVVFLTENYQGKIEDESNYCSRELLLGLERLSSRRIIVVAMEEEMMNRRNWGNKLKFHLPADLLLFDLSMIRTKLDNNDIDYQVQAKMDELYARIVNVINDY